MLQPPNQKPRLFYGWVIVGACFLAEAVVFGMGSLSLSIFMPVMRDSLGWTLTALTGAHTTQALMTMVTAPLIGPLVDRYGARRIMIAGSIVAGFGLMLTGGVNYPWQFWVLYGIVGTLGFGEVGQISVSVVISRWFTRKRGRALAIATSGTTAGGALLAPMITFLLVSFGWRLSWVILGAIALGLLLPVISLFIRSKPEDKGMLPDGEEPAPDNAETAQRRASKTTKNWTLIDAARTRTLWQLVIAANFSSLAGGVFTHLIIFLTSEGMSIENATVSLSVAIACASISRLLWASLADFIPVRYCVAGNYLFSGISVLCLIFLPAPANIILFICFWGLLGAASGPLQPLAFANYFGSHFLGSINGTMRPLMGIFRLFGPLLTASIWDATRSFFWPFLMYGLLSIIGALLAFTAMPPLQRTPTQNQSK